MSLSFEDVKRYLPQNLASPEALFQELKSFPDNIDERMFSRILCHDGSNSLYQGDVVGKFPILILPNRDTKDSLALLVSNTCDMDLDNPRDFYTPCVSYVPLINLNSYRESFIRRDFDKNKIDSYFASIRKQRISNMFYLPQFNETIGERVALLDRLISCENGIDFKNLALNNRVISLSNYGHYLFCIKISIHMTRLIENVERG
jgi:hypothetical protein